MLRKRWRIWIGIAISAVFLYLALRNLHLADVWAVARQAHYGWIIPGVAVYFIGVWARTWRWDYLLRPMKRVPLRRLFPVVVIGYMGNNVYPARAGELIRAYVLRRREDISVSASLATIIIERVFDGLVMLMFVFIGLPFTPMPAWLQWMVIAASVLFFGALAVFMALAIKVEWAEAVYNRLRGAVHGRIALAAQRARCADALPHLHRHLVGGDGQILVGDARLWLQRALLRLDVDERYRQPGDDYPLLARLCWHL
jgi:uncharacterized protein (TIRG00374 family)